MNYDYVGHTPVVKGERVEVLDSNDEWVITMVEVPLASQFMDVSQCYYFYTDRGLTWRKTLIVNQE